jgi:nucleotide-binding universal stress UspA family protein
MFETIIWATDGSEAAERALPTAVGLVRGQPAKLAVVHADERIGGRAAGYSALADEDDVRVKLESQVGSLIADGIDAELLVKSGINKDPADLIADVARELGADLIVVGTRGHGRMAGMLLGSVTQRLLHVSPCPVLAVPVHVAAPAAPVGAR